MIEQHYLDDTLLQLRKLKAQGDRAMAQIEDEDLFAAIGPESNSIAIIIKHMAGNMRSRWTDFLASDGEKPDRNRDTEFELTAADTAESIRDRWEAGWRLVLDTIGGLSAGDLQKTVRIRGEAHTVLEAINRQVTHYAAHVGQIIYLARHSAGERWESLSIPKGRSKEVDVAKSGTAYGLPDGSRPA